MVSALSARLLSGYNSANSSSSINSTGSRSISNQVPDPISKAKTTVAKGSKPETVSSGYSADYEASLSSAAPLGSINLPGKKKRSSRREGDDTANKRRRMKEMNYMAANVPADIERGGLPYPHLRPRTGIDTSTVKHLTSADVPLSPFLTAAPAISYDSMALFGQLADACREYYAISDSADVDDKSRGGASITSSVSDNDSNYSGEESTDSKEVAEDTKAQSLSMGEALAVSSEARVITQGSSPFIIVHTNAAFSRTTGYASSQVVGRPFGDFLENKELLTHMLTASDNFVLKVADEQAVKLRAGSKVGSTLDCKVIISPVGKQAVGVTHLAMEIQVGADKIAHAVAKAPDEEIDLTAMSVMG